MTRINNSLHMQSFGQYFKQKRIANGKTLREFCVEYGFDPSVISKIERDRRVPDSADIAVYAEALELTGLEYQSFCELAEESMRTPLRELTESEIVARLPVFLGRSVDGDNISQEKLEELIELIVES